MKAIFVTFADLGSKRNLKTDEILPALEYFEEKGVLGQVISRVGTRKGAGSSVAAIPYMAHAVLAILGRTVMTPSAVRRIEEVLFDMRAAAALDRTILAQGAIVFVHPDACTRTVKKAKALGGTVVAIPSVADQRYVKKLLASELQKWGGSISRAEIDGSSVDDVDYIVTNSAFGTSTYVAEGFPADRIYEARYDVDTEKFAPDAGNASRDSGSKKFTVLFPASNTGVLKGLQYLLDAWKDLDVPNKELVVLGYRSFWPTEIEKKYAAQIQNDPTIVERGIVRDPSGLIKNADAVVLPSFTEGFGKTIAEAMSCGVPVITTDRVTDLVRDGENGIIVPVGSSQSIKDALMYLYEHPDIRKKMGESGRQTMLSKKPFGEELFETYQDIVQKGIDQKAVSSAPKQPDGSFTFVIRDDDLAYFSSPKDIQEWYGETFAQDVPVTFSTIPYITLPNDAHLPDREIPATGTFFVGDNRELVAYVKENPLIEIALHGYTHQGTADGIFEYQQTEGLIEKTREGKVALEGAFGKTVNVFVAPHDQFSTHAILAIEKAGARDALGMHIVRGKGVKNFLPRVSYVRAWIAMIVHRLRFMGTSRSDMPAYPHAINLGGHQEAFGIRIESGRDNLMRALRFTHAAGGNFILVNHIHDMTPAKKTLMMELIKEAKGMGARFVKTSELFIS